ncbi:hypothetical protein BDW22DRAFT_1019428 [Trametopsis cervina]|nr:hypothetical protein BDW22DRAFT_1019428 [Trametopsis cervina]
MVVMWRACALWNWSRSVLVVAGLFVVLPLIFACVDVATTQVPTSESHSFQPNAFGFVALLLSLLSNIWATALIGYKAWKHRRVINMHVGEEGKESRVLRVLTLLVESGLLYSLIWALFIFTRIFNGGSFSHAAHIIAGIVPQLVGVYPSLIIILVDFQKVRNQRNDALGPDSLGPGLGPTHSTLRFAGPTSHAGVTNSRITETSERQHETSVSNSSSSHSDSHTSWQDLKALEEAVPNADLDDAQEK